MERLGNAVPAQNQTNHMQATVTSNDSIKLTVNANELALISYALSYFGHNASTANFPQGDKDDALSLGDETFNVYAIVQDDPA
jgi:hypothetical protein